MSFHSQSSSQDAVPDTTASHVSDTTTSVYSGVSNLTDNSTSRASRTSSGRYTSRSDDTSSLRRDREREGRCADCGAQTHELHHDPDTGSSRKIPLNIEGEVRRGRCLLCNPLPMRFPLHHNHLQNPQQQQQQHFYESQNNMDTMDTIESVHSGGSSITQQHEQHDRSYWRTSPQPSHSSASQSLDGMGRRRREGRSDMSVHSAQSHNSAPVFGMGSDQSQHSNADNTYPMAVHSASNINRSSALQPPLEELSIRSSRGRHSHRHSSQSVRQQQHRQHQERHYENNSAARNEYQEESEDNTTRSIQEILSSMQRYPNHIPTQSKGMHSLWVLSWDSDNASTIGRMGGVPLIIDSMRLHSNTATLQSNGIATLQNLALDGNNRGIIIESNGVALVVSVMGQFLEDKAIQQSGCTALANLADGSVEQKKHLAESGGILAMMRAVDTHRGDESILRAAYQALRKLGYNPGS